MLRSPLPGERSAGAPIRHRRRSGGQAIIEFSLTFPLLLLLGLSIVEYSRYLETVNNMATVVRDGTRFATVQTAFASATSCTSASTACSTATIQGVLQAEAESLTGASGGFTLANTNCTWSSSAQPPALSLTRTPPDTPASPATTVASCITIAFYPAGTAGAPPALGTAAAGYYLASSGACSGTCSLAAGTLIQITTAADQADTGNVLIQAFQSTFNVHAIVWQTYSLVVL